MSPARLAPTGEGGTSAGGPSIPSDTSGASPLMTVCAWCDTVLRTGSYPISHGMCDPMCPEAEEAWS